MSQKVKNPCIGCHKEVVGGKAASCCVCDRWILVGESCGLLDSTYKLILDTKDRTGSHCWACDGCGIAYKKLNNSVVNNTTSIANLTDLVTTLAGVAKANKDAIALTNTRVDTVEADVRGLHQKRKEVVKDTTSAVLREMDNRKLRSPNLIFYCLPEPDSGLLPEDRMKYDKEKVKDLLSDIGVEVEDYDCHVKLTCRLGRKKENPKNKNEENRPVKLVFKDEKKRDTVLKSAYLLAKSKYKYVSISPDLTEEQRVEEKRLLAEAKELNEKMNEEDSEQAKKWIWVLPGPRGNPNIRKVRRRERGERLTGGNVAPIGSAHRDQDQDQELESNKRGRSPGELEGMEGEEAARRKSSRKTNQEKIIKSPIQ